MRNFLAVAILTVLWGCNAVRPASNRDELAFSTYQEDLSGSLPKYPDYNAVADEAPAISTIGSAQSVDEQLNEVQLRLTEKNKSEPYFGGYTVLVFSGIDRNQAFRTQDDLKLNYPNLTPEMQYQQPRYLVKLGKYTYKVEAQKALHQIKGQFPTARIIQDRFQRKEYVAPTTDQNAPNQN